VALTATAIPPASSNGVVSDPVAHGAATCAN
jgi:hypothetical protein